MVTYLSKKIAAVRNSTWFDSKSSFLATRERLGNSWSLKMRMSKNQFYQASLPSSSKLLALPGFQLSAKVIRSNRVSRIVWLRMALCGDHWGTVDGKYAFVIEAESDFIGKRAKFDWLKNACVVISARIDSRKLEELTWCSCLIAKKVLICKNSKIGTFLAIFEASHLVIDVSE